MLCQSGTLDLTEIPYEPSPTLSFFKVYDEHKELFNYLITFTLCRCTCALQLVSHLRNCHCIGIESAQNFKHKLWRMWWFHYMYVSYWICLSSFQQLQYSSTWYITTSHSRKGSWAMVAILTSNLATHKSSLASFDAHTFKCYQWQYNWKHFYMEICDL